MNLKVSKTNAEMDPIYARLDEIRMSGYERLEAKARMERAQAFADAVAALVGWLKRTLKSAGGRHYRRPTTSAG